LEVPAGTTVAVLKESLVKRYPKMVPAQNSIMAAINREYAADEQVIPLDAAIALFFPVPGGLWNYGLSNDHIYNRCRI
jgi:molybdopterin converting factor small subunit